MSIAVEVEGIPDATTRQIIDRGLDEYNFSKAGPDNAEDLWVIARDGEGFAESAESYPFWAHLLDGIPIALLA